MNFLNSFKGETLSTEELRNVEGGWQLKIGDWTLLERNANNPKGHRYRWGWQCCF